MAITAIRQPPQAVRAAAAALRVHQLSIGSELALTQFPRGTGLPLAIQWVGGLFQEAKLLRVAQAYEKATPWRDRRPVLAAQ